MERGEPHSLLWACAPLPEVFVPSAAPISPCPLIGRGNLLWLCLQDIVRRSAGHTQGIPDPSA